MFTQSFWTVVIVWEVEILVQTSTQVWLGPVPAVHAVVVLLAMNGTTSLDQQGNEKTYDTTKRLHGASKVGHFERAIAAISARRLYDVGGADTEHPSRKALAP